MIVRNYLNRHNASFLQLVRSMMDERAVYDAVDYQLMDMYYYEDYILLNEDYITLVAENKLGDIIGFCVGTVRHDLIDIKILFVARSERGNGYGKLLKQMMASTAQQLGKRSVTAHNAYSNPISLRLNNSLGWTINPVGDDEGSGVFDYYKSELVFGNRTIAEWDEMSGIHVLDPDGFDRTDAFLHLRRFSAKEYLEMSLHSTLEIYDREMNIAFINHYNGEKNATN